MLEKPALQDEMIIACLRANYRLPITGIEFLPIGNDATAWVYRVNDGDGNAYFLKVKKGKLYEPSLLVPRCLKDNGIVQVVAPLPTRTEALWAEADGFTLILYPFVEGDNGMEVGLSDSQWLQFGAVLRNIHASKLPPQLSGKIRKETFVPKWAGLVKALQAEIQQRVYDDPFEQELASFWREKSAEIGRIVDRTEELGRVLQKRASEFVLCHADIHTANILIDGAGRLHIVDWDETLFAPRERDLMFVIESVVGKTSELFFKAYGQTAIDPVALAYYRYEWVVQEFGDYGERVFMTKDTGEETRADAVQGMKKLFAPDDVVEVAYEMDAGLSSRDTSWTLSDL